jgi:hypothetical protein
VTFFPLGGPIFGVSTEVNLAYFDALRSMSHMASDRQEAEKFAQKAEEVKEAILQNLWDDESGTLRMSDSSPPGAHAMHFNAYGMSLGISPQHPGELGIISQSGSAFPSAFKGDEHWESLGLCSPYSAAFAMEACFERNAGAHALDLCKRVYGVMADEESPNYSGCLWEAMTLDGKPYHGSTSLNHAWSSSPVYLLPMYLAGLKSTKSGWTEWAARPVLAGVEDVEARVKTPSGCIKIHWTFEFEKRKGAVILDVPKGTQGLISPPDGWNLLSSDGAHLSTPHSVRPGQVSLGLNCKSVMKKEPTSDSRSSGTTLLGYAYSLLINPKWARSAFSTLLERFGNLALGLRGLLLRCFG